MAYKSASNQCDHAKPACRVRGRVSKPRCFNRQLTLSESPCTDATSRLRTFSVLEVEEHLEIMSEDPWGKGWLVRIKPSGDDMGALLDAAGYDAHIATAH